VFSALVGGAADARTLARRVSAEPRNLSILLNALVAMGLLESVGEKYRGTRLALEYLSSGPRSKRSILLHHLDCCGEWAGLEKKVRGGRKGRPDSGGYQENFIRGMEDNARERAVLVAAGIPIGKGERVLDLGGGPGTYAVEWAKRYPDAEITIFDTPETLRVTSCTPIPKRSAAPFCARPDWRWPRSAGWPCRNSCSRKTGLPRRVPLSSRSTWRR
jgi:hypothetical protein